MRVFGEGTKSTFLYVHDPETGESYGNLALLEYLVQSYGQVRILVSKYNQPLIEQMINASELPFATSDVTDEFQPYVLITISSDSTQSDLIVPDGRQMILLNN